MAKYLDDNGLLYFWQKIKNIFAQKTELPTVVSKYANGLAPKLPDEMSTTKFLRQDGTWNVPAGTTSPATATPLADDTPGAVGTSSKYAREDHVHPTDTTRASASDLSALTTTVGNKVDKQSGKGLSTNDYTTAEKNKLAAFGDASTYALKSDLTGLYKYKGSVASASNLPATGNTTGDVYNIESESIYGGAGMNVAWNGTEWDPLGEIFSITSITNSEIDTIVAS
jgi:hypothetical protein